MHVTKMQINNVKVGCLKYAVNLSKFYHINSRKNKDIQDNPESFEPNIATIIVLKKIYYQHISGNERPWL